MINKAKLYLTEDIMTLLILRAEVSQIQIITCTGVFASSSLQQEVKRCRFLYRDII